MTSAELTRWLTAERLTPGQLARELLIDVSTVKRWESGARQPPPYLPLALRTVRVRLKLRRRNAKGGLK